MFLPVGAVFACPHNAPLQRPILLPGRWVRYDPGSKHVRMLSTWNDLPHHVQKKPSLDFFRSDRETLLFTPPPTQYICNGLTGCKTQNYYLPPTPPIKTNTCHIFHSAPSSSSTAGSCLLSVVVKCMCMYVLKIIPQDTILCSINAFIIDREERQGGLPSSRSQPLSWRRLWQQPQPRQQPTRPPQPVPPP